MRYDEKASIAMFCFLIVTTAFGIGGKLIKIGGSTVDAEDFDSFVSIFEKIFLLLTMTSGYIVYKNNQIRSEEIKEQEERDRTMTLRNTTRTIFGRVSQYINQTREQIQGNRPQVRVTERFSGSSFLLPSPTVAERNINTQQPSPSSRTESISVVIDPMEVESKVIYQSQNERRASTYGH